MRFNGQIWRKGFGALESAGEDRRLELVDNDDKMAGMLERWRMVVEDDENRRRSVTNDDIDNLYCMQ